MINEYLCYPKLLCMMSKFPERNGQSLSFGEHPVQHIILHIPSKVKKSALIVYIHGGGWRNGSPEGFSHIGDFFLNQGFVTAMLGYRKAPRFKHPCQIEDIGLGLRKAIDSIKAIACDKIVVIGSSSGGHLGALLCLDEELHKKYNLKTDTFQGFCSLSGILSFDDCLPNWSFNHLLKGFIRNQSDYRSSNPINLIKGDEKFSLLCIHGEDDPLVYFNNAMAFFERFETAHPFGKQFEMIKNKYHSDVSVGLFYEDNNERRLLNTWLSSFD
ncbi:MAG: alpha/beta hydrolase [Lachnoclostridium sp.]|nr:alpha/beta hydrolase [Lachnoclostridium sp.]